MKVLSEMLKWFVLLLLMLFDWLVVITEQGVCVSGPRL